MLLHALTIVVFCLVLSLATSLGLLGIGWFIGRISPLDLFQGVVVAGVALVSTALCYVVAMLTEVLPGIGVRQSAR